MNNVLDLEVRLIAYQESYYAGHPEVSDSEYDALRDELATLHPESVVLSRVGSEVASGTKRKHTCPMGSQDKASTPAEFDSWAAKHPGPWIAEYKLDGCSLELQYENGIFVAGVTRGDGIEGEDITANVRKMNGFVSSLTAKIDASVRGECIMKTADFTEHGEGMANARNAAAGIMKRSDGKGAQHLSIITYDVSFPDNGNPVTNMESEDDKLAWLLRNDFTIVPASLVKTSAEATDIRNELALFRGEGNTKLPYEIDGLVFKSMTIDRDDEALARPERQIAYKFDSENAVARMTGLTWSQSGKTHTPVVQVTPTRLCGVTVTNISLHNLDIFSAFALAVGDAVLISRRGDVIPHIEKVVERVTGPNGIRNIEKAPDECLTCGGPLHHGTFLECTNPKCYALVEHQIAKWLMTLGVKGIGPAIIHGMVEDHVWQNIPDLYRTRPIENCSKTNQNIYDAVHSKKEISLAQYIAGFDIDGIGTSTINTLVAAGFRSLPQLLSATVNDLTAVPGIGEITAEALLNGIEQWLPDMIALTEGNLITVLAEVTEGALLGETVVFTGPLATMTRDEAKDLARGAGAVVKDSVTKGTTILVTNDTDSGSAKNKKAASMGIAIMNEMAFLARCEKGE